ncbi:unnamed protein product [Prunus armeniaca]
MIEKQSNGNEGGNPIELEGIPITPVDHNSKNGPGAIFILEKTSLEVAKVGKTYELLNSDDHTIIPWLSVFASCSRLGKLRGWNLEVGHVRGCKSYLRFLSNLDGTEYNTRVFHDARARRRNTN